MGEGTPLKERKLRALLPVPKTDWPQALFAFSGFSVSKRVSLSGLFRDQREREREPCFRDTVSSVQASDKVNEFSK